jgi:hypothetical protein
MALLVEGLDVGKDTRTQLLLMKGWLQIQRRSNYTDLNKAKPGSPDLSVVKVYSGVCMVSSLRIRR